MIWQRLLLLALNGFTQLPRKERVKEDKMDDPHDASWFEAPQPKKPQKDWTGVIRGMLLLLIFIAVVVFLVMSNKS